MFLLVTANDAKTIGGKKNKDRGGLTPLPLPASILKMVLRLRPLHY